MWGQVIRVICIQFTIRIIPTRVGTSIDNVINSSDIGDHPHACGDKSSVILYASLLLGSSPRVWGQALLISVIVYLPRIIPTRVGTRIKHQAQLNNRQDHPHACGDKVPLTVIYFPSAGSSPRVWGQDSVCSHRELAYRIIPTRVGTSEMVQTILHSD